MLDGAIGGIEVLDISVLAAHLTVRVAAELLHHHSRLFDRRAGLGPREGKGRVVHRRKLKAQCLAIEFSAILELSKYFFTTKLYFRRFGIRYLVLTPETQIVYGTPKDKCLTYRVIKQHRCSVQEVRLGFI